MKALLWKELQENLRWLPLGMALMGMFCWWCWALQSVQMPPAIASTLMGYIGFASGGFAILLGTMQSAFDLRDGARAYLLQRGVTAAQTFWAKFITGLVIYATAVGVPLICLAAWLGSQGLHHYPVRPAETIPAALSALAAFALHPAMMFTLARPARWWGTRLLPLLGTIVCALFVFVGCETHALLGLLVGLLLVAWTAWSACQAWEHLAGSSSDAVVRRLNWLVNAQLTVAAVAVVSMIANVVHEACGDFTMAKQRPLRSFAQYVDAETGELWSVQTGAFVNSVTKVTASLGTPSEKMRGTGSFTPLPRDLELIRPVHICKYEPVVSQRCDIYFEDANDYGDIVYDRRGYLLAYSGRDPGPNRHLDRVIASDGVFGASSVLKGKPFTCNPTQMIADGERTTIDVVAIPDSHIRKELPLLVDGRGVYQLGRPEYRIHTVIDTPIDAIAYVKRPNDVAPRVLVIQGATATEYQLQDSGGSEDWYSKFVDSSAFTSDQLPILKGVAIHTVELPDALSHGGWGRVSVGVSKRGYTFINKKSALDLDVGEVAVVPIDKDQSNKQSSFKYFRESRMPGLRALHLVPLVVRLYVESYAMSLSDRDMLHHWLSVWPLWFEILLLVVSVGSTVQMCRNRRVTFKTTLMWACAAIPLGLAAPLAIGAISAPPRREVCEQCGKKRRVDRERCDSCRAAWDRPQGEGIELFDVVGGVI